jgi:glycine/D-amino acid oxidase-like deaminating enzyme
MLLLEEARAAGATLVAGQVIGVETSAGKVSGVTVTGVDGQRTIACDVFVNAGGPLAKQAGVLAGQDLPLFSELHRKIAFDDKMGAVPRSAGLVICEDPIALPWDDETHAELAADARTRWLAEPLPAGVHLRPEGHAAESQSVLVLWAYHTEAVPETLPLPADPEFGEIALQGIAHLIPAMQSYTHKIPRYYMDGGYYTKTVENRPLVGPAGVEGAYVLAGLSGYGLMAALATGELLAAYVAETELPPFAAAFHPARYDDPAYVARLAAWGATAQL